MDKNSLISSVIRTSYPSFVDFAFRELHPGQNLEGSWHIDLISDRVEQVIKGNLNTLVINAPPRTLKTFVATIAHIAFYLANNPSKRVLLITGHQSLGSSLMGQIHRLMSASRFKGIFPQIQLTASKTLIKTNFGGSVRSATVGQQLSGHGADLIVIDDPISPSHAQDDEARNEVNT